MLAEQSRTQHAIGYVLQRTFAPYARSCASTRSFAGLNAIFSLHKLPPSLGLSLGHRKDDLTTISDHSYSFFRPACNNSSASFRAPGHRYYHAISHSPTISGSHDMSQPSAADDPLRMADQGCFTPAEIDQLFGYVGTESPSFDGDRNGASHDLFFNFDVETYSTPPEYPAPPPAPDTPNYNFGQNSNEYPVPGPNTPHPYPVEQQHFNPDPVAPLPIRPRPQVLRTQTNTSYLQPSHPPPQYTRRRSLSQGDAERITGFNGPSNPTFHRLKAPRARAGDKDEHLQKRRATPYKHGHSRSTSRGTNSGRSTRSSTPLNMPRNPNLLDGALPTSIGTPMSPDVPHCHCPSAGQQVAIHYEYPSQGVLFRQMARPDQMERSRRIIEVGAMSVRAPLDPTLQIDTETILEKLAEVEQYLKCGGDDHRDALEGCAAIREVLMRRLREDKFGVEV